MRLSPICLIRLERRRAAALQRNEDEKKIAISGYMVYNLFKRDRKTIFEEETK